MRCSAVLLLCLAHLTLCISTATVTCKLDSKLDLYSDGCCISDSQLVVSKRAQTQDACLALCAADATCIAAEIGSAGIKPTWLINATHACSLLYGATPDLPKHCKASTPNKRCYTKACVQEARTAMFGGRTATTTRIHCELGELSLEYDGCCFFDDMYQMYMGNMTEGQCKTACKNNADCISADVRHQDSIENATVVQCFNYFGEDENFRTWWPSDDIVARCFKKACNPITATVTTTTTSYVSCELGELHFVADGCCNFDGFYARNLNVLSEEECKEKCNEDPECIAADIRLVNSTTAPANNVSKLCRHLYGEGNNFSIGCDSSDLQHKCYRKYCSVGCMEFLGYGCCRFAANFWPEPVGVTTEVQCLAACDAAQGCVAADIRYPDQEQPLEKGDTYMCFNFYAQDADLYTACNKNNTEERCYKKTCTSAITTTIL